MKMIYFQFLYFLRSDIYACLSEYLTILIFQLNLLFSLVKFSLVLPAHQAPTSPPNFLILFYSVICSDIGLWPKW